MELQQGDQVRRKVSENALSGWSGKITTIIEKDPLEDGKSTAYVVFIRDAEGKKMKLQKPRWVALSDLEKITDEKEPEDITEPA